MATYIKTNEKGICQICSKNIKSKPFLCKCPLCEFTFCEECLKGGVECKCVNGKPPLEDTQAQKMDILGEMGFPDYICIFALKKFEWNIELCIPWIIENLDGFPKPLTRPIKQIEVDVEEIESEELEKIEDQMKYHAKIEEDELDLKMKKKKKGGKKKRKISKDDDEYDEDIFNEDIYEKMKDRQHDTHAEKCYEIIENAEIVSMIKKLVKRESENLCIDEGNTSLLLKAFEWSADKLENKYFEDPEVILKQEEIIVEKVESESEGCCDICFEEEKLIGLNCGHNYCRDCWKERIKTMLDQVGGEIINTNCMQKGCNCRVNYKLIEEIGDPLLLKRFMYFIAKDFIVHKKAYVFCPVDTCGRAIHYFDISREEVPIICTCGQKFCFKCGREMHKPVTCEQFMEWNDLMTNDSENMKFVSSISKPCFHCGLYTERTDGCNHMTCPRCKGEWCWMCRGDWKTHGDRTGGFYKCNLYETSEAKKLDEKAQQLKEENSVFLKYFDEYIKYNNKVRDLTQRIDELGNIQMKIETQTGKTIHDLIEAAEECKRAYGIVKYTYVFLYFIKDYEQITRLFSFRQQRELKTIETLSELLLRMDQFEMDDILEVRRLNKLVKKASESLSDVTTELIMKNRHDEARKKKKGKK